MGDSDSGGRWSGISGLLRGITTGAPSLWRPSKPPSESAPAPAAPRPSTGPRSPAATKGSERPQRAWNKEDWEEDKRYLDALDLIAKGNKREALTMLEKLLRDDPSHEHAKLEAFGLSILLQESSVARTYADWIIQYHAAQKDVPNLCMSYRAVRELVPELIWAERSLVQVALAADKAGETRIVVDATKLLIAYYKESPVLPRMLFASGKAQLREERLDLARATFEHLVASYPLDPVSKAAEEQLAKLNSRS